MRTGNLGIPTEESEEGSDKGPKGGIGRDAEVTVGDFD